MKITFKHTLEVLSHHHEVLHVQGMLFTITEFSKYSYLQWAPRYVQSPTCPLCELLVNFLPWIISDRQENQVGMFHRKTTSKPLSLLRLCFPVPISPSTVEIVCSSHPLTSLLLIFHNCFFRGSDKHLPQQVKITLPSVVSLTLNTGAANLSCFPIASLLYCTTKMSC